MEGAATKGSKNARVGIIEFADFQCGYCSRFARDTLPALDRGYVVPGKVLMAFRYLPLQTIHPSAAMDAQAAECAAHQGKFWEMHDFLFRREGAARHEDLLRQAAALGCDVAPFQACLKGQIPPKITADVDAAKTLGVSGTPTFLVGAIQSDGRLKVIRTLRGNQTLEQMERAIAEVASQSEFDK